MEQNYISRFFLFLCDMKHSLTRFIFVLFFGTFIPSTILGQTQITNKDSLTKIEALVALKKEINRERFSSQYYAIQIFNGAAEDAQEVLENFKSEFPEIEIELSFETPNYKVRVGRYKDFLKANRRLEELRKQYPDAFLLEPNNL